MCVKHRVRLLRDLLCHVRVLLLHKDRGMNLRPTVISFLRERDHERSASWEGSYNLNQQKRAVDCILNTPDV